MLVVVDIFFHFFLLCRIPHHPMEMYSETNKLTASFLFIFPLLFFSLFLSSFWKENLYIFVV